MGGRGSKQYNPPPPKIVEEPYPMEKGHINLSKSSSIACKDCTIKIDTRATTSSVKLIRDFGDASTRECSMYQSDLDKVKRKELSFQDFFLRLQSGGYSRPASENKDTGESFCEQVLFASDVAPSIQSIQDFEANVGKLTTLRVRKVTGGGSFSSSTKAKFVLSLPIKIKYVTATENIQEYTKQWNNELKAYVDMPTGKPYTPVMSDDIEVRSLTLYHPSPVRIENVQHDAVLSLNDPSDPDAEVVVLVPLRASNMGYESEGFFNKIVKHVISISTPDSVTGLFQRTDIPTGKDWNIKDIFWLADTEDDGYAKIDNSLYTWMANNVYKRVLKQQTNVDRSPPNKGQRISRDEWRDYIRRLLEADTTVYGWERDNTSPRVRYFMMEQPVNISLTDLSTLTRNLPPTPPEEAIHPIPDPAVSQGNMRPLYKPAEGKALQESCGVVRERMENPTELVGNMIFSDTTSFRGEDGNPLLSCDPFENNAKNTNDMRFNVSRFITFFFNFIIVIGVLLGAWLSMYLITLNYDNTYKQFAEDVGKVFAVWAKQRSAAIKESLPSIPKLPSIGSLPGLTKAQDTGSQEGLGDIKGLGDAQEKLPKGLGSFAKLLKK
jgi:hypothetical protein